MATDTEIKFTNGTNTHCLNFNEAKDLIKFLKYHIKQAKTIEPC